MSGWVVKPITYVHMILKTWTDYSTKCEINIVFQSELLLQLNMWICDYIPDWIFLIGMPCL